MKAFYVQVFLQNAMATKSNANKIRWLSNCPAIYGGATEVIPERD